MGRAEVQVAAAELVQLKVDIIVTDGGIAALAAKQATSTIPIVMAASGNPVGTGLRIFAQPLEPVHQAESTRSAGTSIACGVLAQPLAKAEEDMKCAVPTWLNWSG